MAPIPASAGRSCLASLQRSCASRFRPRCCLNPTGIRSSATGSYACFCSSWSHELSLLLRCTFRYLWGSCPPRSQPSLPLLVRTLPLTSRCLERSPCSWWHRSSCLWRPSGSELLFCTARTARPGASSRSGGKCLLLWDASTCFYAWPIFALDYQQKHLLLSLCSSPTFSYLSQWDQTEYCLAGSQDT